MLMFTLIAGAAISSPLGPQQTTIKTALGALFLVANVVISRTTGGYFDASADLNPLLNTWSLSVEEQFYLVFPLAFLLGSRLRRRSGIAVPSRLGQVLTVSLIGLSSLALTLLVATQHFKLPGVPSGERGVILGFYSPVLRAWEFAAGCAIALSGDQLRRVTNRASTLCSGFGLACVGTSLLVIDDSVPFPGPWTCLPVLGTVLLIIGGTQGLNPISRQMSRPLSTRLGDLSYSWYLWHWPMIVFASRLFGGSVLVTTAAAALSLLPAIASFRLVEQPIRYKKIAGLRGRVKLVAATVIPVIALAVVAEYSVSKGYWNPTVRAYQVDTMKKFAIDGRCFGVDALSPTAARDCTWNRSAPNSSVVLIGDSHALHISDAVIEAGSNHGRPVQGVFLAACPVLSTEIVDTRSSDDTKRACDAWRQRAAQSLSRGEFGTVIISNALSNYLNEPTVRVRNGSEWISQTGPKKARALVLGLEGVIRAIPESKRDVIVVHQVPAYFGGFRFKPTECSPFELANGACERRMPISANRRRDAALNSSLQELEKIPGVRIIDLDGPLCPSGMCPTTLNGRVVRLDSNHLSPAAMTLIEPPLKRLLSQVTTTG
jgi:peptidoglycan/LPS O-acetylase OafA/YrhL